MRTILAICFAYLLAFAGGSWSGPDEWTFIKETARVIILLLLFTWLPWVIHQAWRSLKGCHLKNDVEKETGNLDQKCCSGKEGIGEPYDIVNEGFYETVNSLYTESSAPIPELCSKPTSQTTPVLPPQVLSSTPSKKHQRSVRINDVVRVRFIPADNNGMQELQRGETHATILHYEDIGEYEVSVIGACVEEETGVTDPIVPVRSVPVDNSWAEVPQRGDADPRALRREFQRPRNGWWLRLLDILLCCSILSDVDDDALESILTMPEE